MTKRNIVMLVSISLLCLVLLFVNWNMTENETSSGLNSNISTSNKYSVQYFMFNDSRVNCDNLAVYHIFEDGQKSTYAEIPLVRVLSLLGFRINKQDRDHAIISRNNELYMLDLQLQTLYKTNGNDNLLVNLTYGGENKQVIKRIGNDLLIDDTTLMVVTSKMGCPVQCNIYGKIVNLKTGDGSVSSSG